ncbi:unnamed protein product [Choristocarpus tenellus]
MLGAKRRTIEDLDALFQSSSARTTKGKRPRAGGRAAGEGLGVVSTTSSVTSPSSGHGQDNSESAAVVKKVPTSRVKRRAGSRPVGEDATRVSDLLYSCIPASLVPSGWRGIFNVETDVETESAGDCVGGVGCSIGHGAERLTTFVRNVLGSHGEKTAQVLIDTNLRKKFLHLENVSAQVEARSAKAAAGRLVGREWGGLSGKQYKRKGLLKWECQAQNGGRPLRFRDFIGLHEAWKDYALRLVELLKSNRRALHQRLLKADLQVIVCASFLFVYLTLLVYSLAHHS